MRVTAAALILLAGCAGARPPATPDGTVVPEPPPGSPLSPSPDTKHAPLKPFGDLTAGAVHREGFLETYEKGGRLYLVVPRERLGREFLLSTEISQGIGTRGVIGGTMLNIFDGLVVTLELHGDRVFLLQQPHRFIAPPGSAIQQAVRLSFTPSVLASAKIESFGSDSAPVVDLAEWLVSDLSNVGLAVRAAVAPDSSSQVRAPLDRDRSYLEAVKSFPRNLNARVRLTFAPTDTLTLNGVPDSRFITVGVHYAFAELPERPMTPRHADDRVGYFITARKNMSQDDSTYFVRYVNRWRLEPGRRVGALHEPVTPITYYLDRTIPEPYRPYVKEGVEAWNRAFEAAGFTNAIRAELLPDSADAEDLRYPTIRWITSDEPEYGAIGPSVTDPRTGEILDADILFEASMVQRFRRSWRPLVRPAAAINAMLADRPPAPGLETASFGAHLAADGALLRMVLTDRGVLAPGDALADEYVGQAIRWVTMHEVGHTLGLRHNFRSSFDTPLGKLADRDWAESNGVFGSVMEYPSVNLVAAGTGGAFFYNPGVGSYDRWVVEYGYTPDPARAREVARQGARQGHAFGTDEDAFGPGALDPTVNIYDLSDDPLTWARSRADLITGLWSRLPDRVLADNVRYGDLTDAFRLLLANYAQVLAIGVKYVGGQYHYREHVGDPDARPPFRPVPKALQREALDFLNRYAFGERAFAVPRDVLARFGANRWAHWGEESDIEGRIDYPLHAQVLEAQTRLLQRATHPLVFARIRDAEIKFGASAVLTIPELLEEITNAVWSELRDGRARNVAPMRRDLQRAHLDRMATLVLGTEPALPADGRASARFELERLRRQLTATRAASGLEAYTRAHFAESAARIAKVLDAELHEGP